MVFVLFGGWGDALGLWDGNPITLDCNDHCTTISVINSLSNKKKNCLSCARPIHPILSSLPSSVLVFIPLWIKCANSDEAKERQEKRKSPKSEHEAMQIRVGLAPSHILPLKNRLLFYFSVFCILESHLKHMALPMLGGLVRAIAASLCQSHRNAKSKPCLQHIPQLTATLGPKPTERGQGSNPKPHGS